MTKKLKLHRITPDELPYLLEKLHNEKINELALIGPTARLPESSGKWSKYFQRHSVIYQLTYVLSGFPRELLQIEQLKVLTLWSIDLMDDDAQTIAEHLGQLTSLAVLPGEERLISGSEDRTIRLWDLRTMEEVMDLRGHLDTVSWLAVTPDGATIFSVADDYTLRSWDTRTPSELFAARQEYQRAARRLTPYITDLIRERGDPDAVARQIDADESISERDRQIALHLLIRRGLAAVDDAINAEEQPRPQRKPPVAETEENDRRSATRS